MVFKALRLEEITKGVNIYREVDTKLFLVISGTPQIKRLRKRGGNSKRD